MQNGSHQFLFIHTLKLEKPRTRLELRKHFSHRVIDAWNALPGYMVEATTVNMFKAAIQRLPHGAFTSWKQLPAPRGHLTDGLTGEITSEITHTFVFYQLKIIQLHCSVSYREVFGLQAMQHRVWSPTAHQRRRLNKQLLRKHRFHMVQTAATYAVVMWLYFAGRPEKGTPMRGDVSSKPNDVPANRLAVAAICQVSVW